MRWAVTLKPSAAMRLGLSRTPCRASPKGERETYQYRQIAHRRPEQREIIERHGLHASRRRTALGGSSELKPLKAVEHHVVLAGEVEEGRRDRQRDHDGVDALGPHRQRPETVPNAMAITIAIGNVDPPRPAERNLGRRAVAEDRHHVSALAATVICTRLLTMPP